MRKVHTEGFKEAQVQKALSRGDRSVQAIADEAGIGKSTLERWVRRSQERDTPAVVKTGMITDGWKMVRCNSEANMTSEEKLNMIAKASGLSEDELGGFLRSNGIHGQTLEKWRKEAMEGLSRSDGPEARAIERKKGQRIKLLERELRRKDSALAESAALLVLQKKARLLWGDEDDDMDRKSDVSRWD